MNMHTAALIDVAKIPDLIKLYKGRLKLVTGKTPYFTCTYKKEGIIERDEENLLKFVDELLNNMYDILISDNKDA
jgi:hypothetical protein